MSKANYGSVTMFNLANLFPSRLPHCTELVIEFAINVYFNDDKES